jgi:single-strand DNA-binding protein
MSVNKVILIGNVGKDPDVRYLDNGAVVSNFSLATSETYNNKNGERVTNTEWHNIVMWRGLAQVAEKYVRKGSQLYIEGKIRSRSYDDKDGNKRYITEIVADNMTLLGRPRNEEETKSSSSSTQADSSRVDDTPNQNHSENTGSQTDTNPFNGDAEDDLPF